MSLRETGDLGVEEETDSGTHASRSTPELSGAGVRRLRRLGDYVADGQRPAICNVIAKDQCPLQRVVRQRGLVFTILFVHG
jgi:hypothetical protein